MPVYSVDGNDVTLEQIAGSFTVGTTDALHVRELATSLVSLVIEHPLELQAPLGIVAPRYVVVFGQKTLTEDELKRHLPQTLKACSSLFQNRLMTLNSS